MHFCIPNKVNGAAAINKGVLNAICAERKVFEIKPECWIAGEGTSSESGKGGTVRGICVADLDATRKLSVIVEVSPDSPNSVQIVYKKDKTDNWVHKGMHIGNGQSVLYVIEAVNIGLTLGDTDAGASAMGTIEIAILC